MITAYINTSYENSAAHKSVVGTTLDQLAIRRPFTLLAIEFHQQEGNTTQVAFFKSELSLIEKRLCTNKAK